MAVFPFTSDISFSFPRSQCHVPLEPFTQHEKINIKMTTVKFVLDKNDVIVSSILGKYCNNILLHQILNWKHAKTLV